MLPIDSTNTNDSKSDSEERSSSPSKGGPIALCARHDIEIGAHLVEVEPMPAGLGTDVALYVRLFSAEDGSPLWFGLVRIYQDPEWTAEAYGGTPYGVDSHIPEVQSE